MTLIFRFENGGLRNDSAEPKVGCTLSMRLPGWTCLPGNLPGRVGRAGYAPPRHTSLLGCRSAGEGALPQGRETQLLTVPDA